ncbi:MAG TPA: TPM domain-containing protein [Terriglobales bacterium]|nr:TPM domain-containing protein [Terriglobales bacterium]
MKKMARVGAILWIVLAAGVWGSPEPIASLRPSNYVNDFAGVLDASTQARLNDLCHQVEQKAQAQIAVVTVKSVDGQDVVSYAVALYQKWGIGAKGKDRGVLILLATQDHKYWTTVGYGLEPILPDGKVGGFGREMVPLLRSGDYAGAVTLLTTRVASVIAQDAGVTLENQPRLAPVRQQPSPDVGVGTVVVLLLVLFFIVIPVLRSIFRGGGGRGGGGGLGFLLGMLLGGGGFGRGGGYGGGGFGGFGGGGGGGGGFGGGGFGGFGGGSTGGGGAGGSW